MYSVYSHAWLTTVNGFFPLPAVDLGPPFLPLTVFFPVLTLFPFFLVLKGSFDTTGVWSGAVFSLSLRRELLED